MTLQKWSQWTSRKHSGKLCWMFEKIKTENFESHIIGLDLHCMALGCFPDLHSRNLPKNNFTLDQAVNVAVVGL
jgi:hypothetical protein